jgi:thiol-disulfide isomerase/thioredoxin
MANLIDVVKRLVKPYQYLILALIIFIIFTVAGYYAYQKFYINKFRSDKAKFTDVANANRRLKDVTIYFFHVDWCPHCKHALPEWKNFQKDFSGKEMNGYVVRCVDMNCTDETSDVTKTINEFRIESYPTVKMVKDDQKIEFDSKITHNSLEQFVQTMLA